MPHAAVREKAGRVHERAVLEQRKKNSSYQLLSDDDDSDEDYVKPFKVRPSKKMCRDSDPT